MGRPVPDLACAVRDSEQTSGQIGSIARDVFGARTIVRDITVERLERRLLRYSVDLGTGHPWVVIGKVYASRAEGQRGFDAMRGVWDGGFPHQPPLGIHIPRAYSYVADLDLLLMEDVPGEALKKLVRKKRAGTGEIQLFAAALAKLHRCPFVFGDPFRVEDHLAIRCGGLHEPLAEAFPELGGRVRWIVQTAKELEIGRDALTLAHGDFHLGQVHVHEGDVWILDLDPLHVGDPAYDVAMVFVMLKHLEQHTRDFAYIRSLRDAFVAAYFAENDCRLAGRVPLHMALVHLKRACKRFRWQDEPGWPDTIRCQIDQAAGCMEAMRLLAVPQCISEVAEMYDRCPATC